MKSHVKICLAAALLAGVSAPAIAGDKATRGADVSALRAEVATLRQSLQRSEDRASVENLFSRYMYLHNAFRDTDIIPLWAKKGTGIDQAKILGSLDVEAYAEGVDKHPWRTIKTLILTGYYTSQAGGSQELRYEPVPGRWEPDLPVTPETRAISNDWTAVDFG